MNIGALVGGVTLASIRTDRPRMHLIIPGIVFASISLALFGTAQTPLALGVALVGFMLPLPMVNALFMSIFQIKTPPDLQGRIFATLGHWRIRYLNLL